MPKIINLALITLAFLQLGSAFSPHWSYETIAEWPELCRTGEQQSPINIDDNKIKVRSFEKFNFDGYDDHYEATVLNNGHSVAMKLSGSQSPKLSGGGLKKPYKFDHMHFHWGGSEHTINNHRFPLEVHFVHYAEEYKNLWSALNYKDGIAVLGVLYDYSPDDEYEMESFVKIVDDVEKYTGSTKRVDSIYLPSFMPRDLAGFYRYRGSLTTPNCTESVIWTVFSNTLPISKRQLQYYEKVYSAVGMLKSNYRAVQNLNGRSVYRKVSPLPHNAAADRIGTYSVILILPFFLLTNRGS